MNQLADTSAANGPVPSLGGRSVEVFLALRDDLERNVFPDGSKLPTEAELRRRFQVSRTTIRRAVAQLVEEGRLTVRKGSGMFVRRGRSSQEGSRTVSVMFMFDGRNLTELQDYILQTGYLQCAYSQTHSYWDPSKERKFLERVKAERHRALIAFCSPIEPLNADLLAELGTLGVRVIHIEYFRPELPDQSYLLPDYRRAGHMAATRLMLGGCSELHFAAVNHSPYEVLLERGFAEALTEHRGGYNSKRQFFEFPTNISADPKARRTVSGFLKRLPAGAGVFCRSRELADGILSCAGELGLRVPQDFRLAAFDWDVPAEAPGFELIYCDRMAIVRRAVDLVTAQTWTGVRELVAPRLFAAGTD